MPYPHGRHVQGLAFERTDLDIGFPEPTPVACGGTGGPAVPPSVRTLKFRCTPYVAWPMNRETSREGVEVVVFGRCLPRSSGR